MFSHWAVLRHTCCLQWRKLYQTEALHVPITMNYAKAKSAFEGRQDGVWMFLTQNKNGSHIYEGNNTNHSLFYSYREQELMTHVTFSPMLMWFGKQEWKEIGSPLLLESESALEVPGKRWDKTSALSFRSTWKRWHPPSLLFYFSSVYACIGWD